MVYSFNIWGDESMKKNKDIYKIVINNWEKYNSKCKPTLPYIMLSKRFFDDAKIQMLPPGGRLLLVGLLLRRGDVGTTFVLASYEDMVRFSGGSGNVVVRLLDQLQQNQILTYEKMPSNIIEYNIKEIKLKELPASEKVPKEVSKKKENFKDQNNLIKQSYFNAYRLRYGVDHVYAPNKGDAAFNGQIAKLRARIGTDQACNLVKFYVWHEDKFYKESNHSFSLCLRDAEKISNQMLSGVVNKSGYQQKTKADQNLEYFKDMYGQISGDKND